MLPENGFERGLLKKLWRKAAGGKQKTV